MGKLQLNERLTKLMKARGFNMHALASEAKVAVGTIQKLMTDPACNPTIGSLDAICKALHISLAELLGQETPMYGLSTNVVLVDWKELPEIVTNIQNLTHEFPTREIIKVTFATGKNSFALKMKDSSMLPLFPADSILIFDPDKLPKDGCYVLIQHAQYKTIMFKQLLVDEPHQYVKSINPHFKDNIIQLKSADKIIAVLVQAQMQY